jgi:hypothetical protein
MSKNIIHVPMEEIESLRVVRSPAGKLRRKLSDRKLLLYALCSVTMNGLLWR